MNADGVDLEELDTTGPARPGERAARWDLPAQTASAATARALTARTLRHWQITDRDDHDDIVLMVDELVTNAIVHGRGTVRLHLRLTGTHLVAEIGDDDPAIPTTPGPGPGTGPDGDPLEGAEDGRGLMLVGALATAYGTRPDPRGKTVWFSRTLRAVNDHTPAPAPTTDPPATDLPSTHPTATH